jgi:hypothetical protein
MHGREPIVVHRRSAAAIHSAGEGMNIYFLLTGQDHHFSATIGAYEPAASLTNEPGFDRETFAYVLSGKFRLATPGASPLFVSTGDAVIYHLGVAYTWTNISQHTARVLFVTTQIGWRGPSSVRTRRAPVAQ